mmetsp:Transcript_16048/g.32903  ORF Transcript_16048/g.32903 Transcript_16048/m.32903 type:complete len:249 (+) Transcript_16048:536-1282(+)
MEASPDGNYVEHTVLTRGVVGSGLVKLLLRPGHLRGVHGSKSFPPLSRLNVVVIIIIHAILVVLPRELPRSPELDAAGVGVDVEEDQALAVVWDLNLEPVCLKVNLLRDVVAACLEDVLRSEERVPHLVGHAGEKKFRLGLSQGVEIKGCLGVCPDAKVVVENLDLLLPLPLHLNPPPIAQANVPSPNLFKNVKKAFVIVPSTPTVDPSEVITGSKRQYRDRRLPRFLHVKFLQRIHDPRDSTVSSAY